MGTHPHTPNIDTQTNMGTVTGHITFYRKQMVSLNKPTEFVVSLKKKKGLFALVLTSKKVNRF